MSGIRHNSAAIKDRTNRKLLNPPAGIFFFEATSKRFFSDLESNTIQKHKGRQLSAAQFVDRLRLSWPRVVRRFRGRLVIISGRSSVVNRKWSIVG